MCEMYQATPPAAINARMTAIPKMYPIERRMKVIKSARSSWPPTRY